MFAFGRAIAQAVSLRLPTVAARVRAHAGHVGFVMDKAALGQVFFRVHHSTKFSIVVITRGWHIRPIGGLHAEWTQLDSTPQYSNYYFF
jgi:hypothetical protein